MVNQNSTEIGKIDSQLSPIEARLRALEIEEKDLLEKFIKGTGPGGQKINKTASAVFLQHIPSGIEVKCQDGRSLTHNREIARQRLCEALEALAQAAKQARVQRREKIRRQKRRPSANKRKQNVANKRKHGLKKNLRKKPGSED